jgi:hypothetical protein
LKTKSLDKMSKLSPSLKALISAPHARPGTVPAPGNIRGIYEQIAREARDNNAGLPTWLTMSTAATMTMNSPESLTELYKLATDGEDLEQKVHAAELMREVGLKCISFNGIPRTINCLGAFKAGLPEDVLGGLETKPSR